MVTNPYTYPQNICNNRNNRNNRDKCDKFRFPFIKIMLRGKHAAKTGDLVGV
jgi:hypothetical protein